MICIAGKNQISIDGLNLAIKNFGLNNVCVCLNGNDDGISRWQPSLKRYALERGVKICSLDSLYSEENLIFLSLEFDRIISPGKFKTPHLYNIHFSLLPAYKGMYTSAWPILNREKNTGVTLHKIDYGIDTGAIIDQIKFKIPEDANCRDLYFLYLEFARKILEKNFENLVNNNFHEHEQSSFGSTYFSKDSINFKELSLDLNNTAHSILAQIKAFHFREFQIPKIENFPILDAEVTSLRSSNKAGYFEFIDEDNLMLCSVDFNLHLRRDYYQDFFDAVNSDNSIKVEKILDKRNLVNSTNNMGWTALIISAYNGFYDLARILIERGADVNKPNQNGTTPLMYAKDNAIKTGDCKIFNLLISYKADITQSDRFGKTLTDYLDVSKIDTSHLDWILND